MASRRERQRLRREGKLQQIVDAPIPEQALAHPARHDDRNIFHRIYDGHYKLLLLFSMLLLLLALIQIGYQVTTTGDFLNKGVSLKGGFTITVPVNGEDVAPDQLQRRLSAAFPENDILVQGISEFGTLKGITIAVAHESEDPETIKIAEKAIVAVVAESLPNAPSQYSVEIVGPSLGQSFFTQTLKAVCIAFLLMGMVLFFYFGEGIWWKLLISFLSLINSIIIFKIDGWLMYALAIPLALLLIALYLLRSAPSAMVILCAFSDIVGTLAVVNLLGIKISTAGIAAFLMLIGYSVDTDILLSTRVLKHKQGAVYERVISSMKTGMTMSVASALAALVGFLVSQSSTIREIMLIIFIGLTLDIFFTWIQNVGLLRWYVEKRLHWT